MGFGLKACSLVIFGPLIFASVAVLLGCSLERFAAGVTTSYAERSCVPSPQVGAKSIIVTNLGWHTGIIFPTDSLSSKAKNAIYEFSTYPFVEIGWGDRAFYMAKGYSILLGIKALLFSSGSAMHVAGFSNRAALDEHLANSDAVVLRLSQEGFARLENYIVDHFDQERLSQPLAKSLYENGHFYAAKGKFSLFRTCNAWTAQTLREAGCPIEANAQRAPTLMSRLKKMPSP